MQDWLASYVRDHAFDTLTPSERMQFRMACAQGSEAVARWADVTLPKYKPLWQRLKSAERQRRYRRSAARELWGEDWRAAEKNLGTQFVGELRRFQARLRLLDPVGTYETPVQVLNAAFGALSERLDTIDLRPPRNAGHHGAAAVERSPTATRRSSE
jgi:hypothetical protein